MVIFLSLYISGLLIAEIFKNTQSYFRNLVNIKIKQEILMPL